MGRLVLQFVEGRTLEEGMPRQATNTDSREERRHRGQAVITRWEAAARNVRQGAARRERYPYLELACPRRTGEDPNDESAARAV